MSKEKIKIIDIGHSNLSLEKAILVLETTVSKFAFDGTVKVIKVITGHGTGKLREAVRRWCKEQEGRFQDVIYGENYHMFNIKASDMRSECVIEFDPDFGQNNSAVTYIWLR